MAGRSIVVIGVVAGLCACGTEPVPPALTSIAITVSPQVTIGATSTATAVGVDVTGALRALTDAAWSSSDTLVATVSSVGVVTGVGLGTATIIATSGAARGEAPITAISALQFSLTAVAAAGNSSCGLTPAGSVYCWGENGITGKLGNGVMADRSKPTPIATATSFAKVFVGSNHACALTPAGEAWCWGFNGNGQTGTSPTATAQALPKPMAGYAFASLALGISRTCGVTTSGSLLCWGAGILGIGSFAGSLTPVAPQGGMTFKAVATGTDHTCGLTTAGAAYCWGSNSFYQLGDSTNAQQLTPVAVSGGHTFTMLAAGYDFTCGLKVDGSAWCWGKPVVSVPVTFSVTPALIPGGFSFKSLSANNYHVCGLAAGGQAYCWGLGASGQLGDGASSDRFAPTTVGGGLKFVSIAAANQHTCGVASSGAGYCWGANFGGQLGDSTKIGRSLPRLIVPP